MKKRIAAAAMLVLALLMLGGCASFIEQRELTDLDGFVIVPEKTAPSEDETADRTFAESLYYIDESGAQLMPVVRQILAQDGETRAEAVLRTLMAGPIDGEADVYWPEEAVTENARLEVSGGIAVVTLPARIRALSPAMIYAVRYAVAQTMTEISGITRAAVLIGGREEGLDLGATVPAGVFYHTGELDAAGRLSRLMDLGDGSVTRLTMLYFPDETGTKLLPTVRTVTFDTTEAIEYLYTLLTELENTEGVTGCYRSIPRPFDYFADMPDIVRVGEDGTKAVSLRFMPQLDDALAEAGLTRAIYIGMMTETLMGFVPGIEGVRVSIGEEAVEGFAGVETPDGVPVVFNQELAVRAAFDRYVGRMVTIYRAADNGKIRAERRVMQYRAAESLRERLLLLLDVLLDDGTLTTSLSDEDIIAVSEDETDIVLNLSDAFRDVLASQTQERERQIIYAIVNTLTEGRSAQRVTFFFEGAQTQTLSGGLEMRGSLMRNPGIARGEETP